MNCKHHTISPRTIIVGLLLASLVVQSDASAQSATATPQKTDVPVQTVMLFSSGVGYFEHAGRVRDNVASELRFKTSQINDILKSLIVLDLDGGTVAAITYPSQDPLDKTLRSFQVDLARNPSLADLLNQLRGAHVTVRAQAEQLSGTVLGVETRRKTLPGGEVATTSVLNLFTGASIRSVELPMMTSLTLDDVKLQDELTKALAAVSQARDQDKKPVTITFAGNGDRRVRIGYVVETPVWKTSYRLLLDDKSARMQGWAIVENQTEADWNNVSLSLISGRPISFAMDLYQPLYATRPVVTQELFAGLRPQLYDGGVDATRERVSMETAASADFSGKGVAGGVARSANRVALSAVTVSASPMPLVESVAAAARMGDLFQYAVKNVTLARQKSAMIPIVADSVTVERVSIYNADVLASNPLYGVRLINSTGKHLLQGPVTVLDRGGYAGDARIDNLPPGQQRLLSYGIDLDIQVDASTRKETASGMTASIVKGLLILERKTVVSQEYRFDNKGTTEKTIVIEHPIVPGSKLTGTQKPIETTDAVYRFQGKAQPRKVTTLTVTEESQRTSTMAMLPTDVVLLSAYTKGGEIPGAVRDAIVKTVNLKNAIAETERQIAERAKSLTEITQEQTRMRENMRTVGQTTAYYQRLMEKLNEQESTIESIQKERSELQLKRDAQRQELESYLSTLTVG